MRLEQYGSLGSLIAQFECKTGEWPHAKIKEEGKGDSTKKEEKNSQILIKNLKLYGGIRK